MEIAFKNTYSQENGYKQTKPLKTRKTVEIQEISSWLYLGIILYFNWVKIQSEFLGVLPDNSNNKTHIVLIIRPPPHSIHIYKNKIVYYRANNSMSSIFRSSCVFTSRCFLAGLSENRTYNCNAIHEISLYVRNDILFCHLSSDVPYRNRTPRCISGGERSQQTTLKINK